MYYGDETKMTEYPEITPKKEKRKQVQPKHHAAKSKHIARARRKKIIEGIIEGKTQEQAGIDAGLSPKTVNAQVSKILKEPETQKTFRELLDAQIPDSTLSKKISSLLHAKETKFFAEKGKVTDQREVEALSTQADMVKHVTKLKGYLIDKSEIGLDITAIELILSALPPEYAEAVRRAIETAKKG